MNKVRISQVDALFADGSFPIEFLLYYKRPFSSERVRSALRGSAPLFWPAFGKHEDGLISFEDYIEEECYAEEKAGRKVDLSELEAPDLESFSRFRPKDPERLFFLKLVRFKNGIVLIPWLDHLAGDGYSYFYLLSVLATLARPDMEASQVDAVKSMFAPHHQRTVLREFFYTAAGRPSAPAAADERLTVEVEEIPQADVRRLAQEASTSGLRISSNDILSAMAVKKTAGRQGLHPGETIGLTIPIDVRNRIDEFGQRFFGNGILLHTVGLGRERIHDSPLLETAVEIRRSMPSLSKEDYICYLTGLERTASEGRWDAFRPFDPAAGCLVTNLSKLPAERLDFGTGGPDVILPLTVERNSTAVLAKGNSYILRSAF